MRERRQTIPPLSQLPEPDKVGDAADGWTSRIWYRGRRGLRIRTLRDEAVMNEFKDGESVRRTTGDLKFIVLMAKAWFENLPPAGSGV